MLSLAPNPYKYNEHIEIVSLLYIVLIHNIMFILLEYLQYNKLIHIWLVSGQIVQLSFANNLKYELIIIYEKIQISY